MSLPVGTSGATARHVAETIARECARIIQSLRNDSAPVEVKGRGNVATRADKAAEAAAIAIIEREFPDHGILAEEGGGKDTASPFRWVVDPLDGTFNFSRGIPIYSVSIAVLEDDRPVVGVIYDPSCDEIFSGARGEGATLNGAPIRVSSVERIADAAIGYDLGYHDGRGKQAIAIADSLWGQVQFFRTIGSAALGLAYAAAGRYDLYFHHFLYPWDFAAGWLLVEEAGGTMTAQFGAPMTLDQTSVLAAPSALHAAFIAATSRFGPLEP